MVPRASEVKALDTVSIINLSISLSYSRITRISSINCKSNAEAQRHREKHRRHPKHEDTKTQRPPTCEGSPQITQKDTDELSDAAVSRIDGGNVGDLAIAAHRWKARLLRTRAFVANGPPTGRRARGASVPPHPSPVSKGGAIHSATEDEERRGLRSSRVQAAGPGYGDDRSLSERYPGPAVPGRCPTTAGTSPVFESRERPSVCICVICGQIAMGGRRCDAFVFAMCVGGWRAC